MQKFYLHTVVILMLGAVGLSACSRSEDKTQSVNPAELQRQTASPKAKTYLIRAYRAFEQNNYSLALPLADSAHTLAPQLADAHFLYARILTELKRFEKAQRSYARVVELAPNYQGVWYNMANNAFRQGQSEEAIQLYRQALTNHPQPSIWTNMGRAYAKIDKGDSARWAYDQLLSVDTASAAAKAEAYGLLAQMEDNDGRLKKALTHARKALTLDTAHTNYRYMVGSLLYRRGKYQESLPYLKQVTQERPWHHPSYYNLGQALARLKRPQEAKRYLAKADSLQQLDSQIEERRSAARQNPNRPMAWIRYGDALRQIKRYQPALRAYEIALSLTPGNLPLIDNIANLYMELGQTEKAIQQYKFVLARDSTLATTWLNLGVAYARSEQYGEARRAWQHVLKYQPNHPTAQQYLTQLARLQ